MHYSYKATFIQKFVRMNFVKIYLYLHGPGFYNKLRCTNDTDFCSLDYLTDIPYTQFICFKDEDNFIFGFDIKSLYNLYLKNKTQIENPFTKKIINKEVFDNMIYYIKYSNILNIAINIDYSIKNEFMGHAVSIIKCNNKYYFYDTNILKLDMSGKLIYCDDKLDNNLKETLVKCEKTLKENEYDKDSINYIENLSIISYGGGKNEKMEFIFDLNNMHKLTVNKFSENITAINFLSLTDESLIDKIKDCNGSNNNFVINEDLSKEEQFVENIFKCCSSNK